MNGHSVNSEYTKRDFRPHLVNSRPMATRVSALLVLLLIASCGGNKNTVNPRLADDMPQKILWAWERPEDLSFADPNEFGVALLAQTILLEKDRVIPKPRRQPIKVADGAYVIAVTRIETNKETASRPSFSDDMVRQTVALISSTLDLPNVKAIQVDFDAVVSERDFYRRMMRELRAELDKATADKSVGVPLTMTSLASWCTGDAWFNDFPVDEAVPMVFQMGGDSDKIKTYLRNGNDWIEPLCRGSYGIPVEEGRFQGIKDGRRMYYFKNTPWQMGDLARTTH
jgi:hypothetical protein